METSASFEARSAPLPYPTSHHVDALGDSPVVLIHGPRQCGKATLARMVGDKRDYAYWSFDDGVALSAAEADPVGFVAELSERAIRDGRVRPRAGERTRPPVAGSEPGCGGGR